MSSYPRSVVAGALIMSAMTLMIGAPEAMAAKSIPLNSKIAQPLSSSALARAQDGLCGDFAELNACPNVHESTNLPFFMSRIDDLSAMDVRERAQRSYSPFDIAVHPGGCVAPGNYTVNGQPGANVALSLNLGCGASRFSGWINVTGPANTPVTWTLGVHGNDSARLFIGGQQIIDMDWTRADWKRYEHVTFPEPGLYLVELQWSTNHNCQVDPLELVYAPSAVAGFDNAGCSRFGGLGTACTGAAPSPPFTLMDGSVLISGSAGDDDADGVDNLLEGGGCGDTGPDTDGDLTPDYLDDDDDDDGIPTLTEGPSADADNDGVPDYRDAKDLIITSIDTSGLTTDPQTLRTTGSLPIGFRNDGVTAITSPYRITLFIDRDNDGAFSAAQDTALGFINVSGTTGAKLNQSATLNNVNVTLDFIGQPILGFIDSDNQVLEDNAEDNNIFSSGQTRCGATSAAALTASFIRYDISAHPNSISLSARIGNGGVAPVPAGVVVTFYDRMGALIGTALTQGALEPNAFEDVSILWLSSPPTLSPESLTVEVRVDEADLVLECDPRNSQHELDYPIGITINEPADQVALTDTTPALSGTGRPNTRVRLELRDAANNLILSVTNLPVDAMGSWSFTPAQALPNGAFTLTAIPSDEVGNVGLPDEHSFTIDNINPDVVINAPANNSTTNDTTPTITGVTNEPGASITVTLRDAQGTVIQTLNTTADNTGLWQLDATTLAAGSYTVSAQATDAAGNTSAVAGPNAFTVDLSPPSVAITSPINGERTNDTTPTITGSSEPGATITLEVLDGAGNVLQTLNLAVDAAGNFSVDASALPEGDYSARAVATDAAGNAGMPATSTFTIDTTAPALSLDTPVDQSVSPQSSPTIEGSGEPGATVTVAVLDGAGNTVFSDVVTIDAAGQWSTQVAMALADGTYTASAQATDAAGNISPVAGPNTFTVDTTAPTITLTNPAANATIANRRPNLAGTTEANLMVTLTLRDAQGMVVFTQTVTADAQGGFSATPNADLADGDYTLEAATSDEAGNSTTSSSSFTVNATALAIDLTTPADNAILSNPQPTLSGTTEANEAVVITVRDAQGMVVLTQTVTANAQGDFSLTPAQALNDGVYTVSAAVTNAAGVTSTDSSSFTIDTTAPTLALTAPVAGSSTQDTTPTISGTTEPGAVVSVTLTDSNGATVQTLSATANAAGVFTVDAMTLAEGDYTVSATTADAAGNTASAGPNSFSVDTTAPALTFDAPTNGEVFGVRMVVASGTGEVGASVEVELKDMTGAVIATQTTTVDANGAWSANFMGLANGTYDAQATSADAAGNEATASTQFSVDSDEPNLMVTAPAQDEVTNDDTPTLTGTADNDATVTIIIRDAQGNDVQTLTAPVDANGDWTIDATTLPEGDYTASVTATRPNGKSTTVDVDFSVDTTAPTLSLLTPAQDLVTSMTMLTATGKAEPGQEVTITVLDAQGQPAFTGTATADANGDWSLPLSSLADGAYTVEATTADAASNSTTAGPNSFTIDTMAPTVTVTSPAPGSSSQDTTPTITGSAEPGATVEILVDGVKVGEAVADANGDWSLELTDALTPGDHTIEATSTDGAGNQGSSGQIDFTVTNPKAPVVITSPTDGGSVTGPSVTISGTGEPGDTITVTTGDKTETTTVAQDGTWMVTFNDLPEGDASITAQGDGSSATVDITVELVDEPTPSGGFVVTGGAGCAQTPGAPLDLGLLAALGLMGFGLLRRRR